MTKPVICVTGMPGSGKGTLTSRLAREFNLESFDAGLLLRLTAHKIAQGAADAQDLVAAFNQAVVDNSFIEKELTNPDLRSEETAQLTAQMAARMPLDQTIFRYVEHIMAKPPRVHAGRIFDGQGFGTYICPPPDVPLVTFWLDVPLDVRAAWRQGYMQKRGFPEITFDQAREQLFSREERDRARTPYPLRAPDPEKAVYITVGDMDADAVFDIAAGYVRPLMLSPPAAA